MSGSTPSNPDTVVTEDAEAEVYRTRHDLSRDGLTLTIAVALSEITGRPETELIPEFAQHADPDALNRLFRTLPTGDTRRPGHVTLYIAGYEVTVHSDGQIRIRLVDDAADVDH